MNRGQFCLNCGKLTRRGLKTGLGRGLRCIDICYKCWHVFYDNETGKELELNATSSQEGKMEDSLESRQRLYDSIKDVRDEYTRYVLYSQFIDRYYPDAFNAIQELFLKGEIHKNKDATSSQEKTK